MQLLEDIFVNSEWELVTSDSTGDLIDEIADLLAGKPVFFSEVN